eukprot:6236911-Amphidinium_carterae.1
MAVSIADQKSWQAQNSQADDRVSWKSWTVLQFRGEGESSVAFGRLENLRTDPRFLPAGSQAATDMLYPVSYTHLRAHETEADL